LHYAISVVCRPGEFNLHANEFRASAGIVWSGQPRDIGVLVQPICQDKSRGVVCGR